MSFWQIIWVKNEQLELLPLALSDCW